MGAKNAQKRAIFMMILCASLWSIAGIFIKLLPWNPLVIAGARSLVAAVVVGVYMACARIRFVINRSAILNGVFLCLTFLAFVSATKLTTAANAIVMQFTGPIFILIFSSVFFHQRFRRADYIVVLFTTLGIALFFFDQLTPTSLVGNLVGISAGLFMGLMFIFAGNSDETARMSGILLGHLLTALVGLPFAFFFATPLTASSVWAILILGVVQLGIPYVLFGLAMKNCPPLACSLLGAIEPLLNPVWVFLFDGEAPGAGALVGGVIVIAAITLWCVERDRSLAR